MKINILRKKLAGATFGVTISNNGLATLWQSTPWRETPQKIWDVIAGANRRRWMADALVDTMSTPDLCA